MKYNKDIIPHRISKALTDANLSQYRLAEKMQVGKDTVSNWVNGKAVPRTEQLLAMCQILGCDIGYLIDEEQTAKTKAVDSVCEETGLSPAAVERLQEIMKRGQNRDFASLRCTQEEALLVRETAESRFISYLIENHKTLLPPVMGIIDRDNILKELEKDVDRDAIIQAYEDVSKLAEGRENAFHNTMCQYYERIADERCKGWTQKQIDYLKAANIATATVYYYDALRKNEVTERKVQEFIVYDAYLDLVKAYTEQCRKKQKNDKKHDENR